MGELLPDPLTVGLAHVSIVHVVVPIGIDDWTRPSGGNHYDRRVIDELPRWGWDVHKHLVTGSWPTPAPFDRDWFDRILAGLPDDSVVLVDGLMAAAAPGVVDAARRLRLAVLLHMPFAEAAPLDRAAEVARVEAAVLNASAAVVTTSEWTRDWIVTNHGLTADRVWAAPPGVDPSPPTWALATESGTELLCVGPVTPAKGQDVLIDALVELSALPWRCHLVGALDLDPDFVASLKSTAERAGIADRVTFTDSVTRNTLASVRSKSDLLISASRHEAYGMAVTESLATGTPVIATLVGGHREALSEASDGTLPGTLVPADDPHALAHVLRQWLTDAALRGRWRESAMLRREELADWSETARVVAAALDAISK